MYYITNNLSSILTINNYAYHYYTYDNTNAIWLHPSSFQTTSWYINN